MVGTLDPKDQKTYHCVSLQFCMKKSLKQLPKVIPRYLSSLLQTQMTSIPVCAVAASRSDQSETPVSLSEACIEMETATAQLAIKKEGKKKEEKKFTLKTPKVSLYF